MSCDVAEVTERLENELFPSLHLRHNSFSDFFLSLYLRHSSFFNPSVTSPTSQFILHPFFRFSYVTGSSLTLLHLIHSSFTDSSVALPTSQLILQPFRCFIYVTAHSPTLLSLSLRHRLLAYVTSHTSQLILQPFRLFTYVIAHFPTLPFLHLRHSSFSIPSFASPTSQALHLIHLASRPCIHTFSTVLCGATTIVSFVLSEFTFVL